MTILSPAHHAQYQREGVVFPFRILDTEKARKLAFAPHINIGVFSLEKNSKCWKIWQANLKQTLRTGQIFGCSLCKNCGYKTIDYWHMELCRHLFHRQNGQSVEFGLYV